MASLGVHKISRCTRNVCGYADENYLYFYEQANKDVSRNGYLHATFRGIRYQL